MLYNTYVYCCLLFTLTLHRIIALLMIYNFLFLKIPYGEKIILHSCNRWKSSHMPGVIASLRFARICWWSIWAWSFLLGKVFTEYSVFVKYIDVFSHSVSSHICFFKWSFSGFSSFCLNFLLFDINLLINSSYKILSLMSVALSTFFAWC